MKLMLTALVSAFVASVIGAVSVSKQSEPAVWNTCRPLKIDPASGAPLMFPKGRYRVVQAEPLTVEYDEISRDAESALAGTVVVDTLRCEP